MPALIAIIVAQASAFQAWIASAGVGGARPRSRLPTLAPPRSPPFWSVSTIVATSMVAAMATLIWALFGSANG